ncbi:MAG: Crp/Fnr family transcriptional regulator [Chloroflexota bacterium]
MSITLPRTPDGITRLDSYLNEFLSSGLLGVSKIADAPQEMRRITSLREYRSGSFLFHQGDTPDRLHLIADGLIRCYRTTRSGRIFCLNVVGKGEMVGEIPLLAQSPYSVSGEAISDVSAMEVLWVDFLRLIEKYPPIAFNLSRLVATKLKRLADITMDVVQLNASERVKRVLCYFGRHFGSAIPLTHEDIAGLCGITRETASRALESLRADGLIHYTQDSRTKRHIRILALETLGLSE